ncbi:MAG: lytic murein transglycosylase [Candidatus Sungbacteria bacterium]|nr:lytic murein transglycosylase [Candidatus Sungbacteria bacterium]
MVAPRATRAGRRFSRQRSSGIAFVLGLFFLAFLWGGGETIGSAASLSDFEQTLREQVRKLTEEINKYSSDISALQKEAKTLKRDISIIDAQIKKAELEIQARKLAIQELTEQIADKQSAIAAAEGRIAKRRADLERSIRVLNERASDSPLTALFRHSHLAGYFDELASLEQLYQSIEADIREIKALKADLETQRRDLEDEQNEQVALQQAQELQRQDALRRETDKKRILSETKGRESNFQKLVKEGREKLAVLQQQLYLLDTQGSVLTIEQARSMATRIANAVSIRPVFLLGVLTVESDLGRNVGRGTWTKDMSPKERPIFQTLMARLGLDPNQVPVSKKPWYGWGGAMGLAQFIPSTWVAYEQAISAVTGHVPPSPWNAEDAFTAAAIKLSRDGATAQTPEAERKAAQIYFAGSNWNKPAYAFYGERVMDLAGQFAEAFALADSGGNAARL